MPIRGLSSFARRLAAAGVLALTTAAQAGILRFHVSDIQVTTPEVAANAAVDLRYTLSGSGFGIPGGLRDVRIDFMQGNLVKKTLVRLPGEAGAVQGVNKVTLAGENLPPLGAYTMRVTATGVSATATDYVEVSQVNDPNVRFTIPRGVDVNRVPGHPAFGRIYVTEGTGGAAVGRVTQEGVYALNPDLTPAWPGPRATNADLGSMGPWAASANSPFRVTVGPDGLVYITDSSDAHAGLFVADADVSAVQDLFAYPFPSGGARNASGLVTDSAGRGIHGSVSSVWVEGSGANRTVFTTDEDLPPGNTLWTRQVPAGVTASAVPPGLAASITGANWVQDVVRSAAGESYVVSLTKDDAARYDAGGNRVATLPANSYEGVPVSYHAACIDEARGFLLLATSDGRIFKADPAFSSSAAVITGMGPEVRDVATDADGWVYALNATDRRLRVYAPAGDLTVGEGTAVSTATLTVTPRPVPGDVAPVGPEGLYLGENGVRYGDGRVDVLDATMILRITVGIDTSPSE